MFKLVDSEVLKRKPEGRKSRFEGTPEWTKTKAVIDAGIPEGKSGYFSVSPQRLEQIGYSSEPGGGRQVASGCYAIKRFIQRYLRTTRKKYIVTVQHKGQSDIVVVTNPA